MLFFCDNTRLNWPLPTGLESNPAIFFGEKEPTLWRALPAIEELQTAWETKCKKRSFALYHDALNDGLNKVKKYYTRFDEKPAYIIALGMCSLLFSQW